MQLLAVFIEQDLHSDVPHELRLSARVSAEAPSGHKHEEKSFVKLILASRIERGVMRQRPHRAIVMNLASDLQIGRHVVPSGEADDPFALIDKLLCHESHLMLWPQKDLSQRDVVLLKRGSCCVPQRNRAPA